MDVTIIAAIAENRVIGQDGKIPWHFKSDMHHFRVTTMWHTAIMGRKTFQSLKKPLRGRDNIVLTRNPGLLQDWVEHPNVHTARNRGEALLLAGRLEAAKNHDPPRTPTAFVIGGAEIYAEFMQFTTNMSITEIKGEYEGDTFFPEYDCNAWMELTRNQPKNGDPLEFVLYGRVFTDTADFSRVTAWAQKNPRHAWAMYRVENVESYEDMVSTIIATRTLPDREMDYLWSLAGRLEADCRSNKK
jgi:dihydrofolate reductase